MPNGRGRLTAEEVEMNKKLGSGQYEPILDKVSWGTRYGSSSVKSMPMMPSTSVGSTVTGFPSYNLVGS